MFESILRRTASFASEFQRRGKQLYLVGGAVRNVLLGRPASDFDFATDAEPEEIQTYFRKVIPTGIQHGTVTVVLSGESFEVTTFRQDGSYSDGRRPDKITFTPSLEEDLKRRDFTINAIALDLQQGTIIDPHDGQGDLRRKILRAIGDAGQRFDEDSLRLLRLFRFAAQLGFSIDGSTLHAASQRHERLQSVSMERIRDELFKTMEARFVSKAWNWLQDFQFLETVFKGARLRMLPIAPLDMLEQMSPGIRWPFYLTLAVGTDLKAWEQILRVLKVSNSDMARIVGPGKAIALLGSGSAAKAILEAWGERSRVDLGIEYLFHIERFGVWTDQNGLKMELKRAAESGEPIFLSELSLTGKDLIEMGMEPGPSIGQTLRALQKHVWEVPISNSREELTRLLPHQP